MALDDLSLGPLIIGFALSTFLFGITTTQAYIYYGKFPDDPLRFKVLVTVLWYIMYQLNQSSTHEFVRVMELAHTICLTASMYRFFVTLFGSPDVLLRTPTALNVAIIFGCFNLAVGVEAFLVDLATLSAKFDWLITSVWIISMLHHEFGGAGSEILRRKSALEKTAALLDKIIIWTVDEPNFRNRTYHKHCSSFFNNMFPCYEEKLSILFSAPLNIFTRTKVIFEVFAICVIASINARYSLGKAQKGSSGMISLPQSRQYNGDTNASVVASQNLEIGIAIEMSTVTDDATDTEGAKLQHSQL
ncbi:hypothetical protein EV368DRAFT_69754 [Lentinula lateritia]|uniref:Uncharacterized protein n=1 Tax=Lentinula aff. lateritia TaxID=2804960 RepID=A0ACC1TSB1_9AGAR|nr:hypothetical protein F5876DRAFT_67936 [Lentinula aff. lateritia]KAJ3846638.1 hypothetical protein EV368DRAFT_69754 [Lentinula lateritia]